MSAVSITPSDVQNLVFSFIKELSGQQFTGDTTEYNELLGQFKSHIKRKDVQKVLVTAIENPMNLETIDFTHYQAKKRIEKLGLLWLSAIELYSVGVKISAVRRKLLKFFTNENLYHFYPYGYNKMADALSCFTSEPEVLNAFCSKVFGASDLMKVAILALEHEFKKDPNLLAQLLHVIKTDDAQIDSAIEKVFQSCKSDDTQTLLVNTADDESEDIHVRRRAIALLSCYVDEPLATNCLIRQTNNSESRIRKSSIAVLEKAKLSQEIENALGERLNDKDASVRRQAVIALSEHADRESVYLKLVERLKIEKQPIVILELIEALHGACDQLVVRLELIRHAKSTATSKAFIECKDRAICHLSEYHEEPEVKATFLELLNEIPSDLSQTTLKARTIAEEDKDILTAFAKIKHHPLLELLNCSHNVDAVLRDKN